MIEKILHQLAQAEHFPKTVFYNENWLLRIVLSWFSDHRDVPHPLQFHAASTWYSEALIPSRFLPRFKGDTLAEGHTHADGIIGQVSITDSSEFMAGIPKDITQLIVTEGKLGSRLAAGTTHVRWFDQAVRNVAALIYLVSENLDAPDNLSSFAFYVLAPEERIQQEATFTTYMERGSIREKIVRRIDLYKDEADYQNLQEWYETWGIPLLERMDISLISWESILTVISQHDPSFGTELQDYYSTCLHYNLVHKGGFSSYS